MSAKGRRLRAGYRASPQDSRGPSAAAARRRAAGHRAAQPSFPRGAAGPCCGEARPRHGQLDRPFLLGGHTNDPPIGCGVDVVELARFRRALTQGGKAFLRRIFTEREQAYALARPRTALLHLAGRFAAKEATIKAVAQINPRRTLPMNQVEVYNDRFGRPHIRLRGQRPVRMAVHISLSHVQSVAVASAIAIRQPPTAPHAR